MTVKKKSKNNVHVALSAIVASFLPLSVARGACVSSLIRLVARSSTLGFASMDPCTSASGTVKILATNGSRVTAGCIANTFGVVIRGGVKVEPRQASPSDSVVLSVLGNPSVSDGAANTMSVTSFKFHDQSGGPSLSPTITLTGLAKVTYDIGAILNVNAAQTGGTYTGTFTVSATCK